MPPRAGNRLKITLGLLSGSCLLLALLLCMVPRPAVAAGPARGPSETGPNVSFAVSGEEAASNVSSEPETAPGEPAATEAVPVVPQGAAQNPPRTDSGATPTPAPESRVAVEPAAGSTGASPGNPGAAAGSASSTARVASATRTRVAGKLAIIIDDAGYNMQELEPFLELPGALTIAVLPGLPRSAEAARRARSAGKAVLLHLPMEPEGESNPGAGAVYVGMSDATIRSLVEQALASVGAVEGVNNHMGSRATADAGTMRAVFSALEGRGLVFVDSVTTSDSAAKKEAAEFGISVASRDVFLDNEPEEKAMRLRLEEARRLARSRGAAIAIGHVQTAGLAALLRAELAGLAREGITLVSARELAHPVGGTR